jgi:FKBP-type peptidyl-prolyl cis-trans isomerase
MWKQLAGKQNLTAPNINFANHLDSLQTARAYKAYIEQGQTIGKVNVPIQKDGVYYAMLKEGSGALVQASDTVTVHYKGWLLHNEAVFDETKDKAATFPLARLIKGWQIGMPLCRVGGKIRLVIPSGLAYSIRTRSPKIPPNSVLVFDIEVLDAKAAQPMK